MTINDITNPKAKAWVEKIAKMCTPDSVHMCDGIPFGKTKNFLNRISSAGQILLCLPTHRTVPSPQ